MNFLADNGNAADLIICLKKSSSFSSYEKLVKLDENFTKFVKIRVKKKPRSLKKNLAAKAPLLPRHFAMYDFLIDLNKNAHTTLSLIKSYTAHGNDYLDQKKVQANLPI